MRVERKTWRGLCYALFLFHFALPSLSARLIQLFTLPGVQDDRYDELVRDIRPGEDTLRFTDGREFRVTGILGEGMTTLVLEVEGNRALRIPLRRGQNEHGVPYTDWINCYSEGHPYLEAAGVGVVGMHSFRRREYVEVELLRPAEGTRLFSLADFYLRNVDLPPERRAAIETEFIAWARTTARMRRISDFHAGQLLYTDRGWVLADWGSFGTTARTVHDLTAFLPPPAGLLEWLGSLIAHTTYVDARGLRVDVRSDPLRRRQHLPRRLAEIVIAEIQDERRLMGLPEGRERCRYFFGLVSGSRPAH